jgi:hypothetical protein
MPYKHLFFCLFLSTLFACNHNTIEEVNLQLTIKPISYQSSLFEIKLMDDETYLLKYALFDRKDLNSSRLSTSNIKQTDSLYVRRESLDSWIHTISTSNFDRCTHEPTEKNIATKFRAKINSSKTDAEVSFNCPINLREKTPRQQAIVMKEVLLLFDKKFQVQPYLKAIHYSTILE